MFQEESRTVQVNGKAVSGDYQYNANYSVNNDDLSRLHCEIKKRSRMKLIPLQASSP